MATRHPLRWVLTFLLTLALLGAGSAQDETEAPEGKVRLKQDIGGHTGPVRAMAFAPSGKRLYTIGLPGEVAEWDVETGRRLRVWRLPGYSIHSLAISANGTYVAANTRSGSRRLVWRVNLTTGQAEVVRRLKRDIHALALSPDGRRLALHIGSSLELHDLGTYGRSVLAETSIPHTLAFHPSGRSLLTASLSKDPTLRVRLWDPSNFGTPTSAGLTGEPFRDPHAAWSPDGKRVAVVGGRNSPTVLVFSTEAKPRLLWKADRAALARALKPAERGDCYSLGVHFLSGTTLAACWHAGGSLRIAHLDTEKNTIRLLPSSIALQHERDGRVAFFPDGRWLASTSDPAFQVALYDLQAEKEVRRLGPNVSVPRAVAWGPNGYTVAWGYQPGTLQRGLSLDGLEPVSKEDLGATAAAELPPGWKLENDRSRQTFLVRNGTKVRIDLNAVRLRPALGFKDAAGKDRLIISHDYGHKLSVVDADTGEAVAALEGRFVPVFDLALSPDRKYVLVATGRPELDVYALTGGRQLLSIFPADHDWMVWAREGGYYAATPGGERLAGWKVDTAIDQLASYYPARRFQKTLYRPEVIRAVLKTGSLRAALKLCNVSEVTVEDILPPRVKLLGVRQDQADPKKVTVEVDARSTTRGQPITALRLLLDGRPVASEPLEKGAAEAGAKWTVEVPAGKHELKVLARCRDVWGVSPAREVVVPGKEPERPALHLLAVGLNHMGNPELDLKCPRRDAETIKELFTSACVGKGNLFSERQSKNVKALVEQQATRAAVRQWLAATRKGVKPGDLVVFFFAGHGVRDGGKFYLLTHGSNLDTLEKTALSGEDLYEALKDLPCQVLVLLDTCHSAAGAQALRRFKPATDDAARELADEECAVTVLAAAMSHEKALEPATGAKHGLFTQALVTALIKSGDVAYNKQDGRQYVHHLFSHVFDDVKTASKDRQHPFLSLPWTVESFPVRQVDRPEGAK